MHHYGSSGLQSQKIIEMATKKNRNNSKGNAKGRKMPLFLFF
jgi:hypothetical protein